ncbi:hypothetical protein [Oceanobacillus halotolerans]|uniref:hypothetical protein n=1 Tax=Oceanobacillus halotolerans TaxID=2663380 RepID=UPI0013D8E8FC|nr:hypothetical protein [Oceanobacillus halotolerans]
MKNETKDNRLLYKKEVIQMIDLFINTFNTIEWFHLSNLIMLGLKEEHIIYILIFTVVLLSYIVLHPLIHFFVMTQSSKMLSYVCSSLLILVLFLTIIWLGNERSDDPVLFKMVLQTIGLFGFALIVINGFKRMLNKQ